MPKLSSQIDEAIAAAEIGGMDFGEFMDTLSIKSHMFPVLIFTAPFLFPIPIPVFSSVAGVLTIVVGISIFLGIKPWIPNRIAKVPLSKNMIIKALSYLSKSARILEKYLPPKTAKMPSHRIKQRLHGILVVVCGVIFMVPLPPFAHMPTAVTVGLLAIGDLENNGLLTLMSYIGFAINFIILQTVIVFGIELIVSVF